MDTDCSSEIESTEYSDSDTDQDEPQIIEPPKDYNILTKIFNRQLYGRFTKHAKAKTDQVFNKVPERLRFNFSEVVPFNHDTIHQIFMGFSQCGRFLLSYSIEHSLNLDGFLVSHSYILHVWSFVPGRPVKLVAEHRIFRHFKNQDDDIHVTICQWPTDFEKLVIYGTCHSYQSEAYLTIVTLPSMQRCKDCTAASTSKSNDVFAPISTSQCLKHGVTVDAMLSIIPPYPKFRPNISLAYPDHVILNTGHYLYALNIRLDLNFQSMSSNQIETSSIHKTVSMESLVTTSEVASTTNYPDNISDISESVSMRQEFELPTSNIEFGGDVSDCETEHSEYSKPFHELNISCEPLNVTGRSYWTSSSDPPQTSSKTPRIRMFLHKNDEKKGTTPPSIASSSSTEKTKIDIKIAEKAYEFTEETEKCEKLSLFRKKRLADKKYEFSEDNCENIVPFNLLRHERRFCSKAGSASNKIRSPISTEIPAYFLSPRNSPRSPVLSPNNSRTNTTGPFSPSESRNNTTVYSRFISPTPNPRRSALSPREVGGKKYDIYSPSHIDSDDNDSKLILRQLNNFSNSSKVAELAAENFIRREPLLLERCDTSNVIQCEPTEGLLIVDDKVKALSTKETVQWIRELVRRYSAVDFESASSLVSDGQRDDYVAAEVPVLVYTNSSGDEHHLDVVPNHVDDHIDAGITLIHRSFDAEQFCHRTAKRICSERGLKFTYCVDYDINILNVCSLTGDVICSAYIEIGGILSTKPNSTPKLYCIRFMFIWGAGRAGGSYCVINSDVNLELRPQWKKIDKSLDKDLVSTISCLQHHKDVRVMAHDSGRSVAALTDQNNLISIVLDTDNLYDYFFH